MQVRKIRPTKRSTRTRLIGAPANTALSAKICANEGAAQVIFIEGDEIRETSYKDRGRKYQGQKGATLPKI